jgi:hypothetical protein
MSDAAQLRESGEVKAALIQQVENEDTLIVRNLVFKDRNQR